MKRVITIIAAVLIIAAMFTGCASLEREIKTFTSDLTGGLHRTVSLYDYNGGLIREWSGKMDIAGSDQEIQFDLNGNRTIIQGGIVVVQED